MSVSATRVQEPVIMYWASSDPLSWSILQAEYEDQATACHFPGEDNHEYNCLNAMAVYLQEVLQRQNKQPLIVLTIEHGEMLRMQSTIEEFELGIEVKFVRRYDI
jgi:hypothetical protein